MQCIRKKFFLATLFAISISFSFGPQRQADSLTMIVTAIARSNVYEASYTVGYRGVVSKQYLRFEQLMNLATEQQLLTLTEQHKNAVVRLYALQALKRRKVAISERLKRQFHDDKAVVKVLKGCVADERPLSVLATQDLKSPFELSN
jgi:hypothetical protein